MKITKRRGPITDPSLKICYLPLLVGISLLVGLTVCVPAKYIPFYSMGLEFLN